MKHDSSWAWWFWQTTCFLYCIVWIREGVIRSNSHIETVGFHELNHHLNKASIWEVVLNIVISLKSTIPFRVYSCSMRKFSVTVHVPLARLTAPMTWVNDRWSDHHVGTVVIHCRSRAGQIHFNSDRVRNNQSLYFADKLHPYYKKESYTIQIHHNVEFEYGFLLERLHTIAVSSVSTEEMWTIYHNEQCYSGLNCLISAHST